MDLTKQIKLDKLESEGDRHWHGERRVWEVTKKQWGWGGGCTQWGTQTPSV